MIDDLRHTGKLMSGIAQVKCILANKYELMTSQQNHQEATNRVERISKQLTSKTVSITSRISRSTRFYYQIFSSPFLCVSLFLMFRPAAIFAFPHSHITRFRSSYRRAFYGLCESCSGTSKRRRTVRWIG